MSDIMLLGVLRMPYEMAMSDEMSRLQFHSRAQEAADRIVSDEAEIARLTAERDAAMAGRVKVRPLMWQTSGLKSDRAACYAYGLHGYGYEIFHDGAWFSLRGPDGRLGGALPSPDAAKAAAQADYEARIIAALQPDTERAEPVAHVTSVTYGTHGNKYHVSWRCDVKLGQPLYTTPQPAPAPQAREITVQEAAEVPEVKLLAEALRIALDYVEGCKANNLPDLGAASSLPFIDDVLSIGDAALRAPAAMQKGG